MVRGAPWAKVPEPRSVRTPLAASLRIETHVRAHVPKADFDETVWQGFLNRIEYVQLDLSKHDDFVLLRDTLQGLAAGIRVFYLATKPLV